MNLLSLLHLCPIEDFQSFCDEQVQLPEFIGELISVFQRAVREPFFPDEWIIMHLVQNRLVWVWSSMGGCGWLWVWLGVVVSMGGCGCGWVYQYFIYSFVLFF